MAVAICDEALTLLAMRRSRLAPYALVVFGVLAFPLGHLQYTLTTSGRHNKQLSDSLADIVIYDVNASQLVSVINYSRGDITNISYCHPR